MAKRRGRKRKSTVPRHPGGSINRGSRVDRGTPELQARRRYLAQQGDAARASYPLGVLWANQQISDDQHRAGCRFAWLYAICFGRLSVAAINYEGAPPASGETEDSPQRKRWREACERELEAILKALGKRSAKHRQLMIDLCVYERAPAFLLPRLPSPADVTEAKRFAEGIKIVTEATIAASASYARYAETA